MTTSQYIEKLNKQIEAIEKEDKPLLFGVRSVMALQSRRIFFEGKNSQGGAIGVYGTNPLYFSEKARLKTRLPKFPLKGKDGQTKFKNGKLHKSGYFSDFLSFKKTIGRSKRVSTVDLFLTGTLNRHWANAKTSGTNPAAGATAQKVNQHHYFVAISSEDENKVSRYPNVFNLSVSEKEVFLRVVSKELARALK